MSDTSDPRAVDMPDVPDRSVEATASPPQPSLVDRISDRFSDGLQQGIKALTGANLRPPRRLKSLLSGTWLGHPLHPAITDIPIGAWLLVGIFDVIWLASTAARPWATRGAEVAIVIGVLAALGAALTGMTDWSDSYGAERTVGFYHGLLNLLAEALYIISAVLRFQTASGASVAGAVLGFIGLAVVLFAAYLGGDMVFSKGTGVNHTAWEAANEDYEAVLPVDDLAEQHLQRVMVAGVPVVLMRLGTRYCAISATCSHAGGPLDEGELQEGSTVVQCPWHGSRFRLSDGKALTGPATTAQPRYDVRLRNGWIELRRHQ